MQLHQLYSKHCWTGAPGFAPIMHIYRQCFQVRMFTQNSTLRKQHVYQRRRTGSIQMFMIYSHLIFNRLEYYHPKTWISVTPPRGFWKNIHGARPARLYCEEPNNQPTRSSQVTPAMLREWRRCFVWRWPWCGSFIKIMTGVIFWRMSKTAKTFVTSCSVCVFFWDPPSNPTPFFHLQRARPIRRVHCKCGVIVLHSNYLHCSVVKLRRTTHQLGIVQRHRGCWKKCLISEVSQNIPKTKMAMKNPPWMKMYFLIFHWHFFVFRNVLKNKKTNDGFLFWGEVPVSCVFCRTDIVTCKTHRSGTKRWQP